MVRDRVLAAVAALACIAGLAAGDASGASARAHCRPMTREGKQASHIVPTHIRCPAVRRHLRRWLQLGFPAHPYHGWYCIRASMYRDVCGLFGYPGRDAAFSFRARRIRRVRHPIAPFP